MELPKSFDQVRVVPANRRYWFMRTYSGNLYDAFKEGEFVALGFNYINVQTLSQAKLKPENPDSRNEEELKRLKARRVSIKKLLRAEDPSEPEALKLELQNINRAIEVILDPFARYRRAIHQSIVENEKVDRATATRYLNQLISFAHELKLGDLVIMPSENTRTLAIGEITSDLFSQEVGGTFMFNYKGEPKREPYPFKRRSVKWIKEVDREAFTGASLNMFFSHSALKEVTQYRDHIESKVSPIFIFEDQMFLKLKIKRSKDIFASDLAAYLNGITYFYKRFAEIEYGVLPDDLIIKIQAQSEGDSMWRAPKKLALYSLFAAITGISGTIAVGGTVSLPGIEITSEGILNALDKHERDQINNDILREELKREQIETAELERKYQREEDERVAKQLEIASKNLEIQIGEDVTDAKSNVKNVRDSEGEDKSRNNN